jgi:hypothetical protein
MWFRIGFLALKRSGQNAQLELIDVHISIPQLEIDKIRRF